MLFYIKKLLWYVSAYYSNILSLKKLEPCHIIRSSECSMGITYTKVHTGIYLTHLQAQGIGSSTPAAGASMETTPLPCPGCKRRVPTKMYTSFQCPSHHLCEDCINKPQCPAHPGAKRKYIK